MSQRDRSRDGHLRLTIVAVLLLWTYLYNLFIKEHGAVGSFFKILDTISDDFVMGTLTTVAAGVGIVAVFSVTKLYTQIISNVYSFRILEGLIFEDLRRGEFRQFCIKIANFESLPTPDTIFPSRVASLLLSFSFMYIMSWIYVILFSEALFFVSWSAGVDLPLGDEEKLLFLPTLALAIPFSARVMAYLRYPYAQDYADFMPGAVFVLIIVWGLGTIFESDQQKFFLKQVWNNEQYLLSFLRNGTFLAFIPVFFEGAFWLFELNRRQRESTDGESAQPQDEEQQ